MFLRRNDPFPIIFGTEIRKNIPFLSRNDMFLIIFDRFANTNHTLQTITTQF